MSMWQCDLADAAATEALGAALAAVLPEGVVYLHGDLGAGKTTLARGLLRARGVAGPVRSPTYTLLEPYATAAGSVLHLDLYRLADPEELYFLGVEEIEVTGTLALVEWPGRGAGVLPPADLSVTLGYVGAARRATVRAETARGRGAVAALDSGSA